MRICQPCRILIRLRIINIDTKDNNYNNKLNSEIKDQQEELIKDLNINHLKKLKA